MIQLFADKLHFIHNVTEIVGISIPNKTIPHFEVLLVEIPFMRFANDKNIHRIAFECLLLPGNDVRFFLAAFALNVKRES